MENKRQGGISGVSHPWDRIADINEDWPTIARPDVDRLLAIWLQERRSLKDQSRVERLTDQLATRWAIETGIIERLYTIDRGMTETLVDLGIEAIGKFSSSGVIPRHVQKLIADQRAGLEFVFALIKDERPLSMSYIKELHQLLLRNQETTEAVTTGGERIQTALLRGEWKRLPNNPTTPDGSIHECCPPDCVQDEMEALLRWHEEHAAAGVRPEVEAAWLHHRFTQIHPFQDGNGRVARALATIVFLKAGFLPLVIRNDEHREAYLNALEIADDGDLAPLVSLFANIQSRDLNEAITYVRGLRGEGISALAKAAATTLKRRMDEDDDRLLQMTERLVDIAVGRFKEVAYELNSAFGDNGVQLDALVERSDNNNEGWWHYQVIAAARRYQYFADLSRFRRWTQLRLVAAAASTPRWHMVVSFHHKETRTGLMAAAAFLTSSDVTFDDQRELLLGSQNEFNFSTAREPEAEFRAWLEGAVARLLELWQARL